MRSGKLDRTITIRRLSETVTPAGTVAQAWADVVTVRAELLGTALADQATGAGEGQGESLTFRVRYVSGVTVADQIAFEGRTYGIKTIHEFGRRRMLELVCEALR
jgi:SPP1 family predicted phage head-tail adaptor